jgi:hypothetical protein
MPFYPDDTLLVSYPKSGNTWMRFILSNLLQSGAEEINFHNALNYIPDDNFSDLEQVARPRIIKSHEPYQAQFPRVIYIVRDPRDAYVSYFEYLRKKLPEGMTFSAFLRQPSIYPCRWHEHVASWIDKPSVKVLVKYEDMLSDCFSQMQRVLAILPHVQVSDEQLRRAIDASSFSNMRKIEETKGRPFRTEKDRETATTFVRKGIKGDWRNHFSQEDERLILEEAGHSMRALNYLT